MSDQFTPAALPEICAPRRGLVRRFERAAAGRFVYVGAPAGSGKTVSALLWLAAGKRRPVWITLDAYDNAPSVFYKLFATGLLSTQPDNENMRRILFSPDFSAAPMERTIAMLAERIPDGEFGPPANRPPAGFAIVLDDMHLITSAEIHKSLPAVLRRLPRNFVTVVLSRNEILADELVPVGEPVEPTALRQDQGTAALLPPAVIENFNLLRLIPNPQNGVITGEHLKFSQPELAAYFTSLGRTLSNEEADFAWKATGGWPLGINSIAQNALFQSGRSRGGKFSGAEAEYVFSQYIREQLWEGWDESLRDFMLKTSVADEITVELAAALTGRNDCDEVLQKLRAENAFISRAGGGIYHYHHLFLEFLRDMAAKAADFPALNKTAAEYYLRHDQYLIARRYAARSGDAHLLLKNIYEFVQYTNPSLDDYVAFQKTLNRDALPEKICEKYPYLYTSHLYVAWLDGDAAGAEYYWDKLYKHLPAIAIKYTRFLETAILEISLDHRTSFAALIKKFPLLPPLKIKTKKVQGASVTMQMPFVHRSNRDYYELADETLMEKLSHTFGKLLKAHWNVTRPCLESGFLLEQNRPQDALAKAREGIAALDMDQSMEFVFAASMHLAAAQLAMNDEPAVKETLAETKRRIDESGAHYLDRNFQAYTARIHLWNGSVRAAQEWLDNYFVTDYERLPLYKVFQHFTTVRAYMVLNQSEKALRCIEQIEKLAADYRRPVDRAEAGVLRAALEWALGKHREAVAALETVLLEMQELGFIRVIADEGAAIEPVLRRIAARRIDHEPLNREFVAKVLLAARAVALLRSGVAANIGGGGKPIKLSKQQRRMLELLAKGCRNAQIAEITGLALPTVKGHLMLAYQKLEVDNAVDAVLTARRMGLIAP